MSYTLAIETSCDETSVAIIKDTHTILCNHIASQIDTHTQFGGVVPEVASRLHAESIHAVLEKSLQSSGLALTDLNQIAVTIGPGLEGCLLVGIAVAKSLALTLNIPLIPVNHIHGHICSAMHDGSCFNYPTVALVVSGGHTDLVVMESEKSFKRCGKTRDDAAGEILDKVARYLSLGYPGGPVIEKLAKHGNKLAFKLPIPMKHIPFEFSFSGLKTAMIQCIDRLENPEQHISDLCASFQHAIFQTLIYKSIQACHHYQASHLLVTGGVSANKTLVSSLKTACDSENISLITAPLSLCTDNAAMIGLAATHLGNIFSLSSDQITAKPQFNYEY